MVPSTQTCIVQCPSKSTQRGPTVAMSGTVRHHLPVSQPQVTSNINVSRPQQGTSDTTSKNLSVNNSNSETVNTCMSKSTVSSSSKDNYNIQATSSGSNLTSGTSQNELTSLSTQSLTTNAKTSTATIKEEPYEMPHTYRPPAISQLSNCGPMNSATSQEKVDNPEDEEEESDEEVDTGYCQFCKVTFTNPDVSRLSSLSNL